MTVWIKAILPAGEATDRITVFVLVRADRSKYLQLELPVRMERKKEQSFSIMMRNVTAPELQEGKGGVFMKAKRRFGLESPFWLGIKVLLKNSFFLDSGFLTGKFA